MMIRAFLLTVLFLVSIIPISYAMEKGVFQAPSLDGYTLDKTSQKDMDEVKDGIKETTLEIYKNAAGQKIGKFTTNGKTWAWAVFQNIQDVNDKISNYAIRDSRGAGKFDERYSYVGEEFYLPDWVKKAGNK